MVGDLASLNLHIRQRHWDMIFLLGLLWAASSPLTTCTPPAYRGLPSDPFQCQLPATWPLWIAALSLLPLRH